VQWDLLTPTDAHGVRHCEHCDQDVYFCMTDEETIAHARAGHCIARETPDSGEQSVLCIGQPKDVPPPTEAEREADRLLFRERGIDDAIKNALRSSRVCSGCGYPAPDWRLDCRVCGFRMGRATRVDGS
jgi:hypothetical protein